MKLSYNKRLAMWLLVVTLLVVGFSVGASWYIDSESASLLAELAYLPEQVQNQQWQAAEAALAESLEHWQNTRRIWLGLLTHQEVWNIDTAFISLDAFMAGQKQDDALNQLALLEYYLALAAEGDAVTWHNFF